MRAENRVVMVCTGGKRHVLALIGLFALFAPWIHFKIDSKRSRLKLPCIMHKPQVFPFINSKASYRLTSHHLNFHVQITRDLITRPT